MTDTPAAVSAQVRDLLMQRSGEERLRMGARLFDVARLLVRSSLGDPNGTDESVEMRVKLFLRIYSQDFDACSCERIVAHLRGGRKRQ